MMESDTFKEEHVKDNEESARSCFEELYNYRFQDNIKFVEGWRKVKDVIAKEKLYESLVKAQVYFYSRYLPILKQVEFVNLISFSSSKS